VEEEAVFSAPQKRAPTGRQGAKKEKGVKCVKLLKNKSKARGRGGAVNQLNGGVKGEGEKKIQIEKGERMLIRGGESVKGKKRNLKGRRDGQEGTP